MYRKSLVIKRHKDNINRLLAESQGILKILGTEKDYKLWRILLNDYNSVLAKVHIIRRKIDNLNNGLPELGRSIDAVENSFYNEEGE